jgi:hypothetical protein
LLWGRLLIGEALWGNLLAVGRIVVVRLLWSKAPGNVSHLVNRQGERMGRITHG